MKRKIVLFTLLTLMTLVATSVGFAQDADPAQLPAQTGVEIVWPQPVSEVWATVPIIGTANVPNMAYYYIEVINLDDDLSIPQNAPWRPATPGLTNPVFNDVLATIDTEVGVDGLYAIRLTVNTTDGEQFTDIVQPIRLNNTRYDFEVDFIIAQIEAGELPRPVETEEPTEEPENMTPRVAVAPGIGVVNVRRCDIADNERCPIIDSLIGTQEGTVLATSANGTGWYQIRLPRGNVGWVSPNVVTALGDFSKVPSVAPPAPLPPPPPPTAGNISITGLATLGQPVCDETFNVEVNVANIGNGESSEGTVTLQDIHIGSGSITATETGSHPTLAPGANYVVVIPMRTTVYYGEEHELRAQTNGRQFSIRYTLRQGDCNREANPTPTPEPPPSDDAEYDFLPGECTLTIEAGVPIFSYPNGPQLGETTVGGQAPALKAARVGGVVWYQFQDLETGQVQWVRRGSAGSNIGAGCNVIGLPISPT